MGNNELNFTSARKLKHRTKYDTKDLTFAKRLAYVKINNKRLSASADRDTRT